MKTRKLIIAIDGPSGAGKSTLSKALADALGYINIDTGAMYRSVALAAARQRIDPDDDRALAELCDNLIIEFRRQGEKEQVIVNGEDVSAQIRTPEVSLLTARVASRSVVRQAMVHLQRQMGRNGGVVLEGRDIGTVVFPDAEVKFFLSASAEERGRRRYEELRAKAIEVDLRQTIDDVIARDKADSRRDHSPLQQAPDAVLIDSTSMTIEKVLRTMVALVREKEARL